MNAICYPSRLSGTVAAIPSKSDAHRKLICAALSGVNQLIEMHGPFCDDIAATIRCLQALGAKIEPCEKGLTMKPIRRQPHAALDCGESGSTLRFLLPVAMTVCSDIDVTGSGRLPDRPIGTLVHAMSAHGVQFSQDHLPLHASGTLTGGVYEIEGNISSQFLSGLMMALSFLDTDSEIRLTTPLQSSKYVNMTLDTLRQFGADIQERTENGLLRYSIKNTKIRKIPHSFPIDTDWSNAAFWLTAGVIQPSGTIQISGLDPHSVQGDKEIAQILMRSGANIVLGSEEPHSAIVSCGTLSEFDVSMEEIPDLLPILAIRAAAGNGVSHFTNAARLRLKESDRLTATAEMLRALGAKVDELPDGLTVCGGQLRGGTVDAKNDHRLVMSAAIAAAVCSEPVTILGAEAVNKSYPAFFDDYAALGGQVDIIG